MKLTHVDKEGKARMVDVGHKPDTERQARAHGHVMMSREAYETGTQGAGPQRRCVHRCKDSRDTGGKEDGRR